MAGILGMIANPAQADALGAVQAGKQQAATDQAGELLGQTLGGKIGALAKLSPDKAMAYAKALNIPLDAKGRIDKAIGTQVMVTKMLDAGQTGLATQLLNDEVAQMETANGEMAEKFRMPLNDLLQGNVNSDVVQNFMRGGVAFDPSRKSVSAKEIAETAKLEAETANLLNPPGVKRNTSVVGNKIIDSDTGDIVYDGGDDGIKIPPSIVKDLPPEMAARVADAYSAGGGGKDGMKFANEERVLVQEDMRRGNAYEALSVQYPNASEDEMRQLRSAIDTAPTVEKGMTIAKTVRENQRAAQKASVMTDRSLELVNSILDNSELEDVVGSSEGKFGGTEQPTGVVPVIGGFISDEEATAIADIEEVTNILTVPAMEIMTGILSESDLKLLKTISGGAFNRTRKLDRFKKDVGKIQTVLKRASLIGKMSPRDREAAIWATNAVNMKNPDAIKIRQKLGLD